MKFNRSLLVAALTASALAFSGAALADRGGHGGWDGGGGWHGGWHGGYGVGALIGGTIVAGALLAPWYYPGPYYSSYPTVVEVAPAAPTVYMEKPRAAQPAAADAGSWWYYCNESKTYYPYVRECASPWQRVAPTPPATR